MHSTIAPSTLPPSSSSSLKRSANMSPTSFRNEVAPVSAPDPSRLLEGLNAYLLSLSGDQKENPIAILLGTCALQLKDLISRSTLSIDDGIEKDKRERSIVVQGLSESVATKASERVADDRAKVTAMFDLVELEHTPAAVFRMGDKSQSRPRLLKVMFDSRSAQRTFLSKSRDLSSSFPGVFIRPSMTKTEREEAFQLREKKRAMRKEGKDVVIYAGSIYERSQMDEVKKNLRSSRPHTRSAPPRTRTNPHPIDNKNRPFPHIPSLLSTTSLPSSTVGTPPLIQPLF